jgi:hypothetical protein
MPKVRKNVVIRGLSGMLGDQIVFRHMRDGSTVVAAKPDFSGRKFSGEQVSHQERFREAAAYAQAAAKREPIYAELAAGTMKNAYNVALSDWFNPPVIHEVRRDEGVIRVRASDNVKVAGVQVKVLDAAGVVVAEGEAVQVDSEWWEFAGGGLAAEGQRVVAKVWDLAGNVVMG